MGPRIALIPGDGIGPEVIRAAVQVVDAATAPEAVRIVWTRFPWGTDQYLAYGRTMPADALATLATFDAILLGAVGDPRVPDTITLQELVFPIRRQFEQYLNLRPARLLPGVVSPLTKAAEQGIDLVLCRENTEGEYANLGGRFHTGTPDEVALQTNVFTRRACERIARAAFDLAMRRGKRLTSITKSNAQAYSMVLWDQVMREVATAYPAVQWSSLLVDAAAMDLVRRPWDFDVVVASNLFGDILSDIGAAVVGGLGLAPSGNIDPTRTHPSMFEPVHGSAPDIAGRGIANPIGAILSAAMMLEHLGFDLPAGRIRRAVDAVLRAGRVRTPDLGGSSGTREVTAAVQSAL